MVPLMRFKDFIWSKNPETFNISITRDIKELSIPFYGSVMQDYGEQKRIIKGEGEHGMMYVIIPNICLCIKFYL